MSAAFVDDPAFTYFFGTERFEESAGVFARYLFDRRIGLGGVWVIDAGASVSMWNPPSVEPTPTPAPALDLPADALARIDRYEDVVHHVLPTTPHWYLGVLATHPRSAGNKWGRAVMAAGLAAAEADGVPAFLETTNDANVGLYERAGWVVVHTETVETLNIRIMRYPASL